MNRLSLAFRAFFALLFSGKIDEPLAADLGFTTKPAPAQKATPKTAAPAPPPPRANASDGALQMLGILQRDGRLLDFFLEEIAGYSDDQIGSAARGVHADVRAALDRYFKFAPVIDGVEGVFVQPPTKDPKEVKFIGNVPATPPAGGVLRHRGWRVSEVNFPSLPAGQDLKVLAPAELEVE